MQDDDGDDYICSDSDYDSEDTNEEDSLQNVLLITGPIGVRWNLICRNCGMHFIKWIASCACHLCIYSRQLLFNNIIVSFWKQY